MLHFCAICCFQRLTSCVNRLKWRDSYESVVDAKKLYYHVCNNFNSSEDAPWQNP